MAAPAEPLVIMVQAMSGLRGPAQALLEFVRFLLPRRDLLVALPEGGLADHLRDEMGASVLGLPMRSDRETSSWFTGARRLRQAALELDRPVLFHANGLSALNLTAPAARARQAPVLVHSHDHEILPSTRRALRVWGHVGLRTRFVSTSEFTRGLLEGTGVVGEVPGVLASPLVGEEYDTAVRDVHDPFRVGFIGGRQRRKGLHNLVAIADLLRDEPIEWHVFSIPNALERGGFVGKWVGEIRERGLEDRFRWHGWVDRVADAYASVDAVVAPSTKEGFGRVPIEAMASGVPVVAPRISGFSEVVWDGVSGLLYEPGDHDEAATYLRKVAADPQLRADLREGGLRAVRRFDISVVGPTLLRHYEALGSSS